jgi:outer membrane protein assembly factor BamB
VISHPLHRTRRILTRLSPFFLLTLAACFVASCRHVEPLDEGMKNPEPLPINSFQTLWSAKVETLHGPITRLFVRDTLLIGYTDDGNSYVVERATGKILHSETIQHGDQFLHPPVVLKDFIVYPTNTTLEVYDRAGALIRHKNLSYSIRSDAVGNRKFVYLGADFVGGGRLVKVDVTSEYLDHDWELMFPKAAVRAAPAVWGDIVFGAADNGDVTAVSYDKRAPLWTTPGGLFHTYGPVTADLAVDEAGLYVASNDTKLCALNRASGRVKWQYEANIWLTDAPVTTRDKDLVFQFVSNLGYVALDKGAGSFNRLPRWVAPDVIQILAVDEKYVYALRTDKAMIALDKKDGHAVFTSKRHDIATWATNPLDGAIYAITTANRFLAIGSVLKPGVVGEIAEGPVGPGNQGVALAR